MLNHRDEAFDSILEVMDLTNGSRSRSILVSHPFASFLPDGRLVAVYTDSVGHVFIRLYSVAWENG